MQEGVVYRAEGRQLQEAGDLQRATTAYRRAIGVNPHYAEAYNDLGVALESTGDILHAEEAYKTALKLKPELAAAHSNLALLYEENGRLQEAVEHWTARVRMGPSTDAWVLRAREKLIQNNLSVPEWVGSGKAEAGHRPAENWKESARQQKEIWRREEAQRKALKAAVAVPPKPVPVAPKAKVVREQPVPKDAMAVAEQYSREKARTRKTTVNELYDRAVTAIREGRYQEAADQYKQILILDPGSRDARRGLERAEKALAKQLP